MKKADIRKHLKAVFVPRDNGEGVCFATRYMDEENKNEYAIYKAISDAQRDSGLSFDFSYEVAKKAVNALIDADDLMDDDTLRENIDASVPIYTHEVMKIYASDHWTVDEVREEQGAGDSVQLAQAAWYMQIEKMVNAIKDTLEKYTEEEDAADATE